MKRPMTSFWMFVALLVLSFFAYSIGTAQAKAPAQMGSDTARWHVISNPGDSAKTFLLDSLVGETFILTSSGDSFSWKKMEKGK